MAKLKAQTLIALVSNLVRPKNKTAEARHADATVGESPSAYQAREPSKFLHLPEDVLRIIAEHMSPGSRARVLPTCRYLHSLLEGAQYRRLHLVDSWEQAYRLLDTLWERPDLIPCIISYRSALIPHVEYKQTTASERFKLRLA